MQGVRYGEYGGCDKMVTFSDFRNCLQFQMYVLEHYHAVDKHVEIVSMDVFSDNIF